MLYLNKAANFFLLFLVQIAEHPQIGAINQLRLFVKTFIKL